MADHGLAETLWQEWRRSRKPEALGELLKVYRDRMYATALRVTSAPADAEDVVQEACIKLLATAPEMPDLERLEVAIYRGVVQRSLDALRKQRRRETHEKAAGAQAAAETAESRDWIELMEAEKTRDQLRALVADLPDEERLPVVLCFYQGMSVVSAAKSLDIPRETLRARLARTLERLKRQLKQNGTKASAAVILALLWQDGSVAAPPSVCLALDKTLPGRPCAEIPAAGAPSGPLPLSEITSWGTSTAVKAGVAASAICLGVLLWRISISMPPEPKAAVRTAVVTEAGGTDASGVGASRPQPGMVGAGNSKEEETMKFTLGTAAVLGGVLLASPAPATEPNAQVADVVAQIAARQVEKDAAAARAATDSAKREQGERSGWSVNPGGAPGQTIIINR